MQYSITVCGDAAMQRVGSALASAIRAGAMPVKSIFLSGDLGVGKTTLVKGLVAGFGIDDPVTSPTFTLVEPYDITSDDGDSAHPVRERMLYHFDLYRLESPEELEAIGVRDMLTDDNLCVFEWPERAGHLLPAAELQLSIGFADDGDVGKCRLISSDTPLQPFNP